MTKATNRSKSLVDHDAVFAELEASGDLKVIEIDENAEMTMMSMDDIFAMLRGNILKNLPAAVRDDILSRETGKQGGRA